MSLPKVHRKVQESHARVNNHSAPCHKHRQGELDLKFENRTSDPYDIVRYFLRDLRLMCQLIEEAGRYGTTAAMEQKYRTLRTELAKGYQLVKKESGIDLFPSAGFHGSSFEMIFSIYSLDGLVRGSGLRTVERLAEVWRTAQSIKFPEQRQAHSLA